MMGTSATEAIRRLFFGAVRGELLAILLGQPEQRYYLRELLRAVGGGSGSVQRELSRLVASGLVTREVVGHQVYFSANRDVPIFAELRAILEKTSGAPEVLRKSFAPFVKRKDVDFALVYGSVAKGTQTSASDVDVLVVGEAKLVELVPALRRAETQLSREVNVSLYPSSEFRRRLRQGAFVKRVVNGPKIFVAGDERDLERLAR